MTFLTRLCITLIFCIQASSTILCMENLLGEALKNANDKPVSRVRDEDNQASSLPSLNGQNGTALQPTPSLKAKPLPTAQSAQIKKERTLIDELPRNFSTIPAGVWQNHFAPCVDHSKMLFPVPLQPMDERIIFINHSRTCRILKTEKGLEVITPQKKYAVDGIKKEDFHTSPDNKIIVCRNRKTNKIKVMELESGKQLREITARNTWDDPFFCNNQFLRMEDRRAEGQPATRIFDLSKSEENCWPIPNSTGAHVQITKDGMRLITQIVDQIQIYDMKKKNILHTANGSRFRLSSDETYLAVEHDNRIKVYNLKEKHEKELKEMFDQPGKSLSHITQKNKVIFEPLRYGKIEVFDIQTGKRLIRPKGYSPKLSRDEKYVAIEYSDHDKGIYRHDVYDIQARQRIYTHKAAVSGFAFSNDSRYFISPNTDERTSTLVDLQTKETWQLQGISPSISPDDTFCALTRMNKIEERTMFDHAQYSLEVIIVDLKSKKIIRKITIVAFPATRAWAHSNFSADGSIVTVDAMFCVDTSQGTDPNQSTRKSYFIDLSQLKDPKFQQAIANQLTPEQSTFLMVLDEIKEKNKGKEISLLHDIALKRSLPLKQLQDTLASFHPLIRDSIIKRYKIIDPTPDLMKQAHAIKQEQTQNNAFWKNITKGAGFAALVGALGWWYWKKK